MVVYGATGANVGISTNGVVIIRNSSLSATGGAASYGAFTTGGMTTVYNSTLTASSGPTYSYGEFSTGNHLTVANSQLSGTAGASFGVSVCPYSVNATTFAPLTADCQ